jgi:hypothetical protein
MTASNASLKLGEEHKLRAERSQLLVCAHAACPSEIRKECLARVDEVNAQIPTIVLSAKDRKGTDISAVKVTMDGEVLAERRPAGLPKHRLPDAGRREQVEHGGVHRGHRDHRVRRWCGWRGGRRGSLAYRSERGHDAGGLGPGGLQVRGSW